jgi:glycosyltransferase involved in cell wall biosynthesis
MKILFSNRPKNLSEGGDYVQMEATAKALRSKGIEVEINDQPIYTPAIKYRSFDLIHTWNFSMPWTPYQLGLAFMYRKPTVCSMIYHNRDDFVKWEYQQDMANHLDEAVFLNNGEVERLKDKVKIDEAKINVVPNGIDEFWFKKLKKQDVRPYVLTVGRVESHKGQLGVAKACRELGIRYLMVGEAKDELYLNLCLEEGAIHEPSKTREELIKIYDACSCFVLNSKAEIQPLTIMEVGARAKNIVVSTGCLWKVPNAYWVECDDIKQIKDAIKQAIVEKPNTELRDWLKTQTWDNVADQLIEVYNKAILKHKDQPAFTWKVGENVSFMETMRGRHAGQDIYIIGKGPSLKYLTKEMIGEGVVITLNDAIAKIEELDIPNDVYAMEKDGYYKDNKPCFDTHDCSIHSIMPKKSALLVHKWESLNCMPDYTPRYIFDNEELGLNPQNPSMLSAIMIGSLMGCKKFHFVSFDAFQGDHRTYIPGKDITLIDDNGYDGICQIVQPFLKEIDYEWITPKL